MLDFSSGFVKTDSIEVLALANGSPQTVQFAAELPLLTPGSPGQLIVSAEPQDTVTFNPAWQLQSPTWTNQGFAHRVSNLKDTVSLLNTTYWTNPLNSGDVNGDGQVTPIDALLIINTINRKQTLRAPTSQAEVANWVYLDPNRSSSVEPMDALLVINAINSQR